MGTDFMQVHEDVFGRATCLEFLFYSTCLIFRRGYHQGFKRKNNSSGNQGNKINVHFCKDTPIIYALLAVLCQTRRYLFQSLIRLFLQSSRARTLPVLLVALNERWSVVTSGSMMERSLHDGTGLSCRKDAVMEEYIVTTRFLGIVDVQLFRLRLWFAK